MPANSHDLPSALEALTAIQRLQGKRRPAVFLDYDGTLTPIVERPELAAMPEETRNIVNSLASRIPVAVISGRDLQDVRSLVGIEGLFYAGSHGFEIDGPGGWHLELEEVRECLPKLDEAERKLREELADITGSQVERKRFSVAVHYRRAAPEDAGSVERTARKVLAGTPGLKLTSGKKVFELQPAFDWHKGKALRWLLDALDLAPSKVMPVFLGDDITDENAFAAVEPDGVGIIVRDEPRETAARYALESPDEVREFLQLVLDQERARAGAGES